MFFTTQLCFINSPFVSIIIVCLFISTLNMFHTFVLSDMTGLIMVVKNFKTYFKYSKHIHPQTNEHKGTH